MQQSSIFDEAVTSLSSQERAEMLQRITLETDYKEDIVLCDADEQRILNTEQLSQVKNSLTLYERIMLFVSIFIFREHHDRCVELLFLKKSKAEITKTYSHFIDFNLRRFLPPLKRQFEELSLALEVFRRPLLDALGEHRKEFYAILGAEEIPVIHRRLEHETDCDDILQRQPLADNAGLKNTILRNCDDILREISKQQKASISMLVRILVHLERLVSFNFSKCLALFSKDDVCPFELLVNLLEKLNDITHAFTVSPPTRLLQCLFIFSYQAQRLAPEGGLGIKLKNDFKLAADAMLLMAEFNRIPLTKLLRVIKENCFYNPAHLSGGEDWSLLYKKFWKSRIERSCRFFISKRKLEALRLKTCQLLNLTNFPTFTSYNQENCPKEFNLSCPLAFTLVYEFYQSIFTKLRASVIQPILNSGNFYRKAEKTKILDAVDFFYKNSQDIQTFVETLETEGDIGKQFKDVTLDSKKLETLTAITSRNAVAFIHNTVETLRLVALAFREIYNDGLTEQHCPVSNLSDLYLQHDDLEEKLSYYTNILLELWTLITDLRDVEDRLVHIGLVYDTNTTLKLEITNDLEED